MIISHKNKYVFIQLDNTASSAMGIELVKNYGGESILWKHARYEDFMRIANSEEKKYFIFSGIRNPMDSAVSNYFFRKLGYEKKNKINLKKHFFIETTHADFTSYFHKYISKNIYENWKTKKFHKLGFVYKYENIQTDFSKILEIIGEKQKRPLPILNTTPEKEKNYEFYYPEEIQGIAKIIFRDFMKKWDYSFPNGWREPSFKEKILVQPVLYSKFFLQKKWHMLIDHPLIYKKYHKITTI